ncbi:MAG: response regulator [Chloroflexi bacterium]|nr:response regulator [Chloroflexota bacterium]
MRHNPVLIVEDDPDNLELMRLILQEMADVCTLATATSGKEAIRLVEQRTPVLVLCDVALPSNGIAFIHWLRANPATRSIPVIGLSASPLSREEVVTAGFDDFIRKPFDPTLLASKVRDYLAQPPSCGPEAVQPSV